ncbi:hypothetical protein PCE1_003632 [Barthelona sp. PCE]
MSAPTAPTAPGMAGIPVMPTAPMGAVDHSNHSYVEPSYHEDESVHISPLMLFFSFIKQSLCSGETKFGTFLIDIIMFVLQIASIVISDKLLNFVILHVSFFVMFRRFAENRDLEDLWEHKIFFIMFMLDVLFFTYVVSMFINYLGGLFMPQIMDHLKNPSISPLSYYDFYKWRTTSVFFVFILALFYLLVFGLMMLNGGIYVAGIVWLFPGIFMINSIKTYIEASDASKTKLSWIAAFIGFNTCIYPILMIIIIALDERSLATQNVLVIYVIISFVIDLFGFIKISQAIFGDLDEFFDDDSKTIGIELVQCIAVHGWASIVPIYYVGQVILELLGWTDVDYYRDPGLSFMGSFAWSLFWRFMLIIVVLVIIFFIVAALLNACKKCSEDFQAFKDEQTRSNTKKKKVGS